MPCSNHASADVAPPADGVCLVPMAADDLEQIVELESRSFGSPWKREHFEYELRENRFALNRVLRRENRIVGYACVWHLLRELKINNIVVHEGFRKRGLGRWFLARLLDEAATAGCCRAVLEVRPSNSDAVKLYEGLGFREEGRRKGYYQQEGEDAILMARSLP